MKLCTTDGNQHAVIRLWVALGFEVEWQPAHSTLWQRSIVHKGDFSGLDVPHCYYRIKPKPEKKDGL